MDEALFQVARDTWVGSGPRHDIAASGAFARPRSTSAEQGCSALPRCRALNGKPETGKGAAVLDRFRVAGGGPGWQVAGWILNSRGDRKPERMLRGLISLGDG